MRHRVSQRKLNRTTSHRKALHRNLAQSLIEHGQVTTTVPKAKDLRPYIERLVTLAIKVRRRKQDGDAAGSLRARRAIHKILSDRGIVPKEHREVYASMSDAARAKTMRMASGRRHRTGEPRGRLAFTAESVTQRLIETIAPKFEDRPGGYTRLIRLSKRRIGDAAFCAVVQFVGEEEPPTTLTKPARSARRRQADGRYALAVKLAKGWRGSKSSPAESKNEPAGNDVSTEPADSAEPTDTDSAQE